jgi:hypothetical protein
VRTSIAAAHPSRIFESLNVTIRRVPPPTDLIFEKFNKRGSRK